MTNSLTLWEIESGLLDLLEARDAAEDDAGRAACDQAIAEYVAREIDKVDRIRGLLKHCELVAKAAREEAADQQKRAQMWEARRDRVKELVKTVMEAHGLKRIEGRTGRLRLQGNGGLAPLEIISPDNLPEECCKYVGWIGGALWARWRVLLTAAGLTGSSDFSLQRAPDSERVRAAVLRDGGVPGARLGERGSHVRVE